jgi:hypothetical protein
MKKKKRSAASDAALMRLALDSLRPNSEKLDDLPSKLRKVRAITVAHQKKKSEGLNWRKIAKLAVHDLRAYRAEILLAAASEQKLFFIDLGKCLSNDMKSGYDKLDVRIATILSQNPSIKAKDAARELKQRGHPAISEDNFRVRKKRLKALAHALAERQKAHEAQIDEYSKALIAMD